MNQIVRFFCIIKNAEIKRTKAISRVPTSSSLPNELRPMLFDLVAAGRRLVSKISFVHFNLRLGISILFMLSLPISAYAGDSSATRVAVVDIEAVLERSTAVDNIKKSINSISDQMQTELSTKENELKALEANLIKQRGVLAEEEFNQKVSEFNKKVSLIQQDMQTKKSALERAHSAALTKVHKNIIDIISELSKKYGFNMVLPSTQVLYIDNDLNITLEVIALLNDRLKTVKMVLEF
jgi:Skp family chaperone for outer membrane proteins